MVLTRRQRKSGIVTPTAPEKKETTKIQKKKTPSKDKPANVAQEEILHSGLTSPPQQDGEPSTPGKEPLAKTSSKVSKLGKDVRKGTPKRHGNAKSGDSPPKNITENVNASDNDSDEEDTTDSKIEKSKFHKQNKPEEMEVDDERSNSEDEGDRDGKRDVLSKLEENNRAISNGPELVEESSDDEAPDSMTFDVARETALETLHQAYKESLKIKSKKKEKRRAHDTMMKEQAKKKVKRCEQLDSNRLPETLLTEANTETIDRPQQSDQEPDEIDGDDEGLSDDDDDEPFQDEGDDNYVIEKEGFQIVPLQEFAKRPVVKSMAASNFRQEQLYGKRIPRVRASSHISMTLKRSSKPALSFKVKGLPVTKKKKVPTATLR